MRPKISENDFSIINHAYCTGRGTRGKEIWKEEGQKEVGGLLKFLSMKI